MKVCGPQDLSIFNSLNIYMYKLAQSGFNVKLVN